MSFSIDQLVADCVAATQSSGGHAGVAVEEVLARTIGDPGVIEATLGHPRDQAMLTTWHHSPELTVLHVVWPPTADLMPHDHLMWAAIGLYGGREDNRIFRGLPEGGLEHRATKSLHPGDTIVLGDDAVHAVTNPSREWTGAIHVYGGDFFRPDKRMWPAPDQEPRAFNVDILRGVLEEAATSARAQEASGPTS